MKEFRHILLLILMLIGGHLFSQGLKEIFIDCDPDEFNYIYENYQEDIFIPVTITHDGTTWPDVLLRLRGDSSREYPKKSMKVQFDSDPFMNGKYTVNFNAEYHDLSYMHSVLSSRLFHDVGIPSPEMEHVRIFLNGAFFGLYIMTENMDDQFLKSNGLDADGILYKASRDGACLSLFDNVFYHWELNHGSDPYGDLLTGLIAGLNDPAQDFLTFVQSDMDYSKLLTFLSLNMLLSNGSTYYHNYFLFRNSSDGIWQVLPWDLDRTFSDYSIWYPFHRSSGGWTPDNPLLEKAILHDAMFSQVRARVGDLHNTLFNPDYLYPLIDSIHSAIASSVSEDTTDNIPGMETWQEKIALDKEFILNRYQQLFYQFNHYPSSFVVDRKEGYSIPGEQIQFSWQPSEDPDGDQITYIFYFGPDPIFEDPETIIIQGIADLTWEMTTPAEPGMYYWMIEATDGNNGIQGYDTRNELFVSNPVPQLVINEINYSSSPDFDPGDWVEFFNPGNAEVDLTGWRFMDENNGHVFPFPAGTTIGANGYLVLCRSVPQFYTFFPSSIPATGDLDFGFDGGGELLRLFDPIGFLVDEVLYRNDDPWPEEPDGTGPTLELLNPGLDNAKGYNWASSFDHGTPGAQNGKFSPDFIGEQNTPGDKRFMVSPNPCRDRLHIRTQTPVTGPVQIKLLDTYGRIVFEGRLGTGQDHELITGDLFPGMYIGVLSFPEGHSGSFLLIKL